MSMGLLLARSFRPVRVRGIFWFSVAVLFALFAVPFLTDGAVQAALFLDGRDPGYYTMSDLLKGKMQCI